MCSARLAEAKRAKLGRGKRSSTADHVCKTKRRLTYVRHLVGAAIQQKGRSFDLKNTPFVMSQCTRP